MGRVLAKAFLTIVALVKAYLFAALLGALLPGKTTTVADGVDAVTVRLVPGPIHYDILLPLTPETRQAFVFLETAGVPVRAPSAEWLIIGWGSEAFYTTVGSYRDVSASAVWKAVTGDTSVLRVDLYGPVDEEALPQEIVFSSDSYRLFLDALVDSFSLGQDGRASPVQGPDAGAAGWFLEAQKRFHLFRTCNVWIGEVMRAAGSPFGMWTPTPYAVRISHVLNTR